MSVRIVRSAALEFDLKRLNKFASYCLKQPSYQVLKCHLDSELPRWNGARGRVIIENYA